MISKSSLEFTRWLTLLITLLILFSACGQNDQTTDSPETPSDELTRSDFDFLEAGMSYDEIVAQVGAPDRDVGSGVYVYEYDLADGSQIGISFITLEHLSSAYLYNPDGTREFVIDPDS